jgi:hypothetical protein
LVEERETGVHATLAGIQQPRVLTAVALRTFAQLRLEYIGFPVLIEGLSLGMFMISGCSSADRLEHPASPGDLVTFGRWLNSTLSQQEFPRILLRFSCVLLKELKTSFFGFQVAEKIRYNPASHRSVTLGF